MKDSRDYLNAAFLNLPGKPFFAAKRTSAEDLRKFFKRLAPMSPVKPLIRVGPDGDGGYLIPDDLEGITACFSPGVSMVSGFELKCAARGMDVFMADASVNAPADTHPKFRFLKNFIGSYTKDEFITMEGWIEAMQPDENGDWIFQIDIEGAEFEVLQNLPERYLRKFRIIAIEFHMLDYLFDYQFFKMADRVFGKLLNQHTCVHIHPNNAGSVVSAGGITIPKIIEFTFYRNDRGITDQPLKQFPHPLDFDNEPDYPLITLPPCWYV